MNAAELLYDIADKIAKLQIFGEWVETEDHDFIRPSPADPWDRARVRVWESYPGKFGDDSYCEKVGWYWEVGFGVLSISRVANYTDPLETSGDAMRAVDSLLCQASDIVLCKPKN